MPTIPRAQAIDELAAAVESAPGHNLAQVYYEMFPSKELPTPAPGGPDLAARIRSGIEPEVALDVWNTLFPMSRRAYYDEEDDTFHYGECNSRYVGQLE